MTNNFQIKKLYSQAGKNCINATVALLLVLLQFACTSDPVHPTSATNNDHSKAYTSGQLTLNLNINKREITVADQLEVILEATAPENIKVEFPSFSASLGDFTLTGVTNTPAQLSGTGDTVRIIHSIIYLLEPYLPGTYTIPQIKVSYHAENGDPKITEIVTEEIQIEVLSLLDKDSARVEIKDIKPPLSLPDNTRLKVIIILALVLVIIGGCGLFYWRKISSKKIEPEIKLDPDVLALQELKKLLAEDLLSKGKVKLFHMRISDILRHYIENRFGFKAPERTTDEFLTELSVAGYQQNSLISTHKILLDGFLNHCDLVKFARHKPTAAECEKTVTICREFIEETKETGAKLKSKI